MPCSFYSGNIACFTIYLQYNKSYQYNSLHIERVELHDCSIYNKILSKTIKKPIVNMRECTFLFVFIMQRWRCPSSVNKKAQKLKNLPTNKCFYQSIVSNVRNITHK